MREGNIRGGEYVVETIEREQMRDSAQSRSSSREQGRPGARGAASHAKHKYRPARGSKARQLVHRRHRGQLLWYTQTE